MILNEGSRDNLLIPIINIYKEKTGKDVSVSAMKQYILAKLVNEANIRNLSMDSNYYLAGTARYYINGDLTTNKVLNIFDETQTDVFDRDICQRLNALILILRNSYIDSVGTKWEQPEDFGQLPLNKLLRKYGAAINKVLGIESQKKENKPEEEQPIDYNIGSNGYTFDILYSYEDARKYNSYTEPGAWCITYGQQHYNSYTRNNKGHFVIFLKNGYEEVPRVKEDNMWKGNKPQDTYGNSMIALLQSNNTGEPILITSRWNHGANGIYCEADHAYTKEEFLRVVGITNEDLQKIQKIWQKQIGKREGEPNEERRRLNAQRLEALRFLKYAQIKMNGGNRNPFGEALEEIKALTNGEKITNTFNRYYEISLEMKRENPNLSQEEMDAFRNKVENELDKIRFNSIRGIRFKIADREYYVLIDGNKILFETLCESDAWDNISNHYSSRKEENNNGWSRGADFNDIVYCEVINGIMLYNIRKHKFVEVDGIKKFKYVATVYGDPSNKKNTFYEVAMSLNQIAIIDYSTNEPVVLPNGNCWCEQIYKYSYSYRNNTYLNDYSTPGTQCLNMLYDRAASERYIFDLYSKTFLKPNDSHNVGTSGYQGEYFPNPDELSVVTYWGRGESGQGSRRYILFKNGKEFSVDGSNSFSSVANLSNHNYFLKVDVGDADGLMKIVNLSNNTVFKSFPKLPSGYQWSNPDSVRYDDYTLVPFYAYPNGGYSSDKIMYIWDNINGKFVKNPFDGGYIIEAINPYNTKTEIFDEKNEKFIKCEYKVETGEYQIIEPEPAEAREDLEPKDLDLINEDFTGDTNDIFSKFIKQTGLEPNRERGLRINKTKIRNIYIISIRTMNYHMCYNIMDKNGNIILDKWALNIYPISGDNEFLAVVDFDDDTGSNIIDTNLNFIFKECLYSIGIPNIDTRIGGLNKRFECGRLFWLEKDKNLLNFMDFNKNLVFDDWCTIYDDDLTIDSIAYGHEVLVCHDGKYNLYSFNDDRFVLNKWVDDMEPSVQKWHLYTIKDDGKYNILYNGKLLLNRWADTVEGDIEYDEYDDSGLGCWYLVRYGNNFNIYCIRDNCFLLKEWAKEIETSYLFNDYDNINTEVAAKIKFKNGVNFLSKDGKLWFAQNFEECHDYPEDNGLTLGKLNGKWNYFDNEGNAQFPEGFDNYSEAAQTDCNSGLNEERKVNSLNEAKLLNNQELLDKIDEKLVKEFGVGLDGHEVLYEKLANFNNSILIDIETEEYGEDLYLLMDKNHNFVENRIFRNIVLYEDFALVSNENEYWNILDSDLNLVLTKWVDNINCLKIDEKSKLIEKYNSDYIIEIENSDGKINFLTSNGFHLILNDWYYDIFRNGGALENLYRNGEAILAKDNNGNDEYNIFSLEKGGFLLKNWVEGISYGEVEKNLYLITNKGRHNVLKNHKFVFPTFVDYISTYAKDNSIYYIVSIEHKSNIFSLSKNKYLIDKWVDGIYINNVYDKNILALIVNNGLWNFVDINGKLVYDFWFERMHGVPSFNENKYQLFMINGKWGCYNRNGDKLFEEEFEEFIDALHFKNELEKKNKTKLK